MRIPILDRLTIAGKVYALLGACVTLAGTVAVLEFSTPRLQPLRAMYLFYFRHILPRIGQWFARNNSEAYEYLPATVAQFPDGEALAERMRGVGLKNVKYWPLTLGVATLYVGIKPLTPET